MDLQLKGLKALITGSTRGIGRAVAERLALEGADIAICARNGDEVKAAVAALKTNGRNVWGKSVDVGDAPSLRTWVEEAGAALGAIDILVANASALSFGIWNCFGKVERFS